jgi:hypothetical protein
MMGLQASHWCLKDFFLRVLELTSIPDLSFDSFPIKSDASRCKLYSNGRFGFEVELISRKTGQYCDDKLFDESMRKRLICVDIRLLLSKNRMNVENEGLKLKVARFSDSRVSDENYLE